MTIEERRAAAVKRIEARRDVRRHLALYVLVNAMPVLIWAMSGAGYFWPVWAIAGWGIGLGFHAYDAFFQRPNSEDDIRREMERTDPQDAVPGR